MKRLDDFKALRTLLKSGSTLVLHSGYAEPLRLTEQLAEHATLLNGLNVLSLMPMGSAPYGSEAATRHLKISTFFPGKGLRAALDSGQASALRYPMSAIPRLFERRLHTCDVLFLQVSSPDSRGFVSLGISVDYMHAVLAQAPIIVAEINPRMPQTCGATLLPLSTIDWYIDGVASPQQTTPTTPDDVDDRLACNVAALLEDGSVLQIGIGSVPDRVLARLGHLKHLGLHSGIITDAVQPLIESGVIDNSTRAHSAGISVTSMAGGTQDFYRFLHRNPAVEFHPCSHTHDSQVLARIDRLCAINSVLQVDLEGNANAEQANGHRVSLPGGLPDFAAGAARAPRGMSIIALRSTSGTEARSNVVAKLDPNVPVTVGAQDIDFVVTEYGIAPLRGLLPAARAEALVAVAHPAYREDLRRAHAQSDRTVSTT